MIVRTKEQREKISNTLKRKYSSGEIINPLGMLGKHHSNETKERMSKKHLGRKYKPMSEEGKKNISIATKGKKLSEETKRKMSISRTGPKSPSWKGGISKDSHSIKEPKYKEWRLAVFSRDNYTCQECGKTKCYLEAHHIKSWAKYPELRYELNNGKTLCEDCHKLTDTYGGKKN